MGPLANVRRKQSIPNVSTFQIDAYEPRRLKSFPPRTAPKPRIIRFSARPPCHHSHDGLCPQCRAEKDLAVPKILPEINNILIKGLSHDSISWWPSLSNGRCTEPISPRGNRVSRDLFQAVVDDHLSFEAFNVLVYACDLVSTPGSDEAENTRQILERKHRIFSLLRKRLRLGQPPSDQVIMTIFFLLTLDLLDGTEKLNCTWDLHLRAIAQLAETRSGGKRLAFPAHLRTRNNTYIEYFKWTKTPRTQSSIDGVMNHVHQNTPHLLSPSWLMDQVSTLPAGFIAMSQTGSLSADTFELVQRSCLLDALYFAQLSTPNPDDTLTPAQLAKEINFHCNDLLLCRSKLTRVEEILVLANASHCQQIAKDSALRFSTSTIGLGISPLLSRLSCVFLGRDDQLRAALNLEEDPTKNAMIWAGSILMATNGEDTPAWTLGQRILRLCDDYLRPDTRSLAQMCKVDFIWPETLPFPLQLSEHNRFVALPTSPTPEQGNSASR
ncbi:MAG: hypothetical protein Q9170_007559 [Blastenia crenularia]